MEDTKLEKKKVEVKGMQMKAAPLQPLRVAGQDLLLLPLADTVTSFTWLVLLSSPINLDTSIFSAGVKLLLGPPDTGCFPHSGSVACSQPSLDFTFFIPNNNWIPHPHVSHVL